MKSSELANYIDYLIGERRSAETPTVSTVHSPIGSPSGPGLWWHKGMQLPAYIQNIAKALIRDGHGESEAIQMAVGVCKAWALGHPSGGRMHRVSPEVKAAAAKAVAEWEKLKAQAHAESAGKGRSARLKHRNVGRDNAAYKEGLTDKHNGSSKKTAAQFAAGHPDADADDYPFYLAGYNSDRDDLHLVKGT